MSSDPSQPAPPESTPTEILHSIGASLGKFAAMIGADLKALGQSVAGGFHAVVSSPAVAGVEKAIVADAEMVATDAGTVLAKDAEAAASTVAATAETDLEKAGTAEITKVDGEMIGSGTSGKSKTGASPKAKGK